MELISQVVEALHRGTPVNLSVPAGVNYTSFVSLVRARLPDRRALRRLSVSEQEVSDA